VLLENLRPYYFNAPPLQPAQTGEPTRLRGPPRLYCYVKQLDAVREFISSISACHVSPLCFATEVAGLRGQVLVCDCDHEHWPPPILMNAAKAEGMTFLWLSKGFEE
jgi:hypothetical protein